MDGSFCGVGKSAIQEYGYFHILCSQEVLLLLCLDRRLRAEECLLAVCASTYTLALLQSRGISQSYMSAYRASGKDQTPIR